jgi:hypothetical protein
MPGAPSGSGPQPAERFLARFTPLSISDRSLAHGTKRVEVLYEMHARWLSRLTLAMPARAPLP